LISVRRARGIEPLDLLLLTSTLGAILWVIDPIYDINDLFWHVLIGDELRSGVSFSEVGSGFSFTVQNAEWRSGAWASEWLMSWLYQVGGWTLVLSSLRIGSIIGVAAVLWIFVVRTLPSRAVLLPYLLVMASLALTVEERPQSLSYIFIAVAGVWWFRGVVDSRIPHWLAVLIVTAVWANLHGLWIVMPLVMGLMLVGRMLDHGWKDGELRRSAAALLGSIAGGLITPLGFAGATLSLGVSSAARDIISEWAVTRLLGWPGYLLLVSAAVTVFLLGRVQDVRRSEILYSAAAIIFGLMAARNVTPALLLLAPLTASLVQRALGERAIVEISAPEARRLTIAAFGACIVGSIAIAVTLGVRTQGPPDTLPIAMANRLSEEPGQVRVLNDYNWSGTVLFYGGPDVQVAVDGRTDYYGSDYLNGYQDALAKGVGLTELVSDLEPTHALIAEGSAADTILRHEGWKVLAADDNGVLLEAP
jgi:hypothetical protein